MNEWNMDKRNVCVELFKGMLSRQWLDSISYCLPLAFYQYVSIIFRNYANTVLQFLHSLLQTWKLRFIFCWPCILLRCTVSDQLDAQFFSMYLFQFSTCFEQPCAHDQENLLYQYNLWYTSLCVGDRSVCRSERKFLSDLHTERSPVTDT